MERERGGERLTRRRMMRATAAFCHAAMINARMLAEYIMHSGTHVQHEIEITGEEEREENRGSYSKSKFQKPLRPSLISHSQQNLVRCD